VRGYKAGILTQSQYANLTQCETLEGPFMLPDFLSRVNPTQWTGVSLVRLSDTTLSNGLWQLPRERGTAHLDSHDIGQGDAGTRGPVQLSAE
jgi:hypothetical protein